MYYQPEQAVNHMREEICLIENYSNVRTIIEDGFTGQISTLPGKDTVGQILQRLNHYIDIRQDNQGTWQYVLIDSYEYEDAEVTAFVGTSVLEALLSIKNIWESNHPKFCRKPAAEDTDDGFCEKLDW
ncbi:hypothetical protein C1940_17320 (plasmid) [Lactiplantibacillus plantarum subsp. plantarum]|uniref:hypothetical protein n=1 Tax=Lactiplantibacillus plantarum TaxID=1590 RepID=UPI000CD33F92|nr:hypothetical protein [Lactiplantibacillus plantarum]AUV74212.1 hypothetical protein C1940_17320 [Lactiplantibacillus plantarum subsp. plantarum]MCT3206466.1 hypothetical protein [Lactiplantibacillus plantarum]MCT3220182.1 hypothetical protein [Lactiplantibacillus plantarum]MCT3281542.1 hypothetical protein [Lactiplantibacillus plantarum]